MSGGLNGVRGRSILIAALVATALLAAVAVSGCGADTTTAQAAEVTEDSMKNTITVAGVGRVLAAPDEAVLSITLETEAELSAAALDANSKQMVQVLDKIKAAGVPAAQIQTSNVSVYPNRRYDEKTGTEKTISYRAQNTVLVTLKDLGKVGDVLAAAGEAGANNVSGPSWRLSDQSAAVQDALKKAVENARGKAEAVAAASGVKVGEVLVISETSTASPVYEKGAGVYRADMSAAGVVPPVNPQDLEVIGNVTVTFRLDR